MPRSLTRALVPIRARRRWSADDARVILSALEASGLSVQTFAARQGLDSQRVYRWRAQLGPGRPAAEPTFLEIRQPAGAPFELVLRSGHVLRISEAFSEAALRRLLDVLEQDRKC